MLDLLLILVLGTGIGWVAKRFGLPAAVGQVLLGLLIGPPLLGWISQGEDLQILGELGVVLLLGMAGLHLGLGHLTKAGWSGLWVAMLGMLFCFAGGYLFTRWWGSPSQEALYVGTVLTATSIGISVQVLHQFGLINKKVGQIVVAAAVIDDVMALYLLALAHGVLTDGVDAVGMTVSVVLAALMFAAIFFGCRWLAGMAAPRLFAVNPHYRLISVMLVIIAFAWVTEWMGYSLVVGGFFAGLGLGEGLDKERDRTRLIQQLEGLVLVSVPFFFVLIGARAEWSVLADEGMMTLLAGLLLVALLGKFLGGVLGAISERNFFHRMLIGVSMAPRGEVALVIASLGFQQGHISHHVLVALVLMTIGTAVFAPLFMVLLARYHGR